MSEVNTIPAVLKRAANLYTNHMAIEDGSVHLTYGQLHGQALRVARALISQGIRKGDRIAIWAPNTWQWIVAALGLQSIGAVLVPVNTRMKGPEVRYILERSQARLVFSTGHFLGVDYAAQLQAHLPDCVEHVVTLGDVSHDASARVLDDARFMVWDQFVQLSITCPEIELSKRLDEVAPSDISDIMFTSGTTGYPKGVMTNHAQNVSLYTTWGQLVSLNHTDRYLIINPFFHAFGYKAGWLACLIAGATILPHAVFDADAVLQRIQDDKVSVMPGPPTLFQTLLAHPKLDSMDLSSLRAASTGASTIAPSLIEKMRQQLGFKVVVTAYGLTETCGLVTMCSPDDEAHTVATTCGRAIPEVEVAIMNEAGQSLPAGEAGEVCVRGPNVMLGYFADTQATEETIDSQGWLHTGDVGVLDEQGCLKITDRLKDLYIVGGFNCYPAEIEKLMSNHPEISQVAVIGVPDERMGEVGKAFVIRTAQSTLSSDALVAWCRDNMTNYKVPRFIEFVSAFPTNASGKVLKRALRDQELQKSSVSA